MDQNERTLIVQLAQVLTQTTIETAFYRRTCGEISFVGHPDYDALVQRLQPLLSQVEKAEDVGGGAQTSIDTALRELLKEIGILNRS